MRVLFAGTGEIGIPTLDFLGLRHELVGIITQPDRPAGRHRHLKAPPIKEAALSRWAVLPLLQPETPRLAGVLEWVCKLNPEVMVTMAYGRILPPELLRAPSIACLNIHASLLPRYRGASPIQATIASGDREGGVTIMHMAEGLDTGDVILEMRLSIRRRETSGSLSERLAELAPLALEQALELLAKGTAPRTPQDHDLATHTGKIGKAECLLDWAWPALELERKIRSLQPAPGAFAALPLFPEGTVSIKIHSAIVVNRASGRPGAVLRSDARGILVASGEGGLLLGSVQPEGGARMHSSAFARGRSLAVDDPS
jgi:methionyl-tRNA formyltransferase